MMNGYCYIDGKDIYTNYGVIIAEGGYNELLQFPAINEPDRNDWAEENGVDVDLSSLTFQAREITIPFAVISGKNWRGFYEMLTAVGYRSVNIPALGKIYTLRVSEMPAFEHFADGTIFEVKFIEDYPVESRSYPVANGNAPIVCAVAMDGVTLDKYGIIIEDGLDDLQRPAPLKQNLTRKNALMSGQIYDTQRVQFADKETTFACHLCAKTQTDFWNLYNAFFGDLTKYGERLITYNGKTYYGYYRKSSNFDLLSHSGEFNLRFHVTLCILR